MLDVLHELLDLALHLLHALAHLQDDRHARDVDAQIARQRKNELQPLQIFVGIEARVTFGARGFEQAFALIEPQRLGVDAVHLGNRRDHVGSLGFSLRHRVPKRF